MSEKQTITDIQYTVQGQTKALSFLLAMNTTLLIIQLGSSSEEKERIRDVILSGVVRELTLEKNKPKINDHWMVGYESVVDEVVKAIREVKL